MINISKRALNIIKILANSSQPVSSSALSEEVGCSNKTIQNEIKDINKQLKKSKILSIRGAGYKLEGSFDEINLQSSVYNDMDRVEYILKTLIKLSSQKRNAIKLHDLADNMYVSLSTVKNDLKDVKYLLDKYNIKIKSQYKQGICISAYEDDIIKCIIDLCIKPDINLSLNEFLSDEIKESTFNVKKIILDTLYSKNIILTDIEFKNIINYILIYLSRNHHDKEEFIKKYMDQYKRRRDEIISNEINKEKIRSSIKEFCENLKIATSIDISKDTIFEDYLYDHIENLCRKIALGINQYEFNGQDLKIKYPFAFELAKIAKKTIENNLNIEINEDEIGNIAIHIGGALERASYSNEKKVFKTIVVCTSGVGTSTLIKKKLENIFKNRLDILKTIPSYLAEYINAMDVDLVISTVPIELRNIPVIKVSPFIDEKEVKIIEKYIETEKIYIDLDIKSLFDEELFFIDIKAKTKEDVINFMSSKLVEKGYIDLEMKKSYFEREKIATTEIGNMVALPHGSNGNVYKNKIAIGILKDSIDWEISKVRLIIMLAFDKDKILDYEELFSNIYKRVDSIAKVINICEIKNFNKFIKMFK